MEKLRLNINDLTVDSFQPSDAAPESHGTVVGHGPTRKCEIDPFTFKVTCFGDSCDACVITDDEPTCNIDCYK